MVQVKMFVFCYVENGEREVNNWIRTHNVKVLNIQLVTDDRARYIMVTYMEDNNEQLN